MALGLLVMLTASIASSFPGMLDKLAKINRYSQLVHESEYVGSYLFRWADFSPAAKALSLKNYSEGSELELSQETRINRLLWAEPLVTGLGAISDEYKASIQFWETTHGNRAVVRVKVWYDANLNNEIDVTEPVVSFSTIVSEKLQP